MAVQRNLPWLLAAGVGIMGGYYAFNQPLKEASADLRRPSSHAHSQTGKEISGGSQGAAGPHNSLRDGVSQVDPTAQTVAGTTESARKSYSGDKDVKFRENAKEQDGTSGGGVGFAEMRERKMAGQGLPSPQGGDTKSKAVPAQKSYAAH